jgi:hypothetical protein
MIAALGAVAVVIGAVALFTGPATAGSGQHEFAVTKAVVGPSGDDYEVQFDCDVDLLDLTFTIAAGETRSSSTGSNNDVTCTLSEIDDGGADAVAIECAEISGTATCDSNDTGTWRQGASGSLSFTVTNTFEEPTPPPAVEPAAEPAAAPVTARPGFTG